MIVVMITGTAAISSFIACQRAPAWSSQIQRRHRCIHRSPMKHDILSKFTYSIKRETSEIGIKRLSFGSSASYPCKGGLGLDSVSTVIVRAQKEDEHRELEKVGNKSIGKNHGLLFRECIRC